MTHPEMTDATQLLNRFVHAVTAYELEDIPQPVIAPVTWEEAERLLAVAVANGSVIGPRDMQRALSAFCDARSATPQPVIAPNWVMLTDEDRNRAMCSMPDMLDGFLKTWGWLHFAKAIEAECRAKNGGAE